jgi:hypothetical protein
LSNSSYPCRSATLRSRRSTCLSRRANWSPDERHGLRTLPSTPVLNWEYVIRSRQAIPQEPRNRPLELLSLLAGPVGRTVRSTLSTPASLKRVC